MYEIQIPDVLSSAIAAVPHELKASRPIPSSDAEFVVFLENLSRVHGVTPAAIIREMRDDAEKMIRKGSMILELVGRIEDRFHPR